MKNVKIQEIFDYLYEHLTPERIEHSYNVAALAIKLAYKNNTDVLKAQIAGLLHDCAKYMTGKELVDFFNKYDRKITYKYFKKTSKFLPHLLHSFGGGVIAKEKFKIEDKDILNAIKNHTQGRRNMSTLEKIIFVADSISDDRKLNYVKRLQELAKKDLEKTFFEVLRKKVEYIIKQRTYILQQIVDTWNWYVSKNK
ncbi:MAG: bis(5'-nucleosyl)-tetraphosphatase (symmetrical) YqeK [Endomicrobium sp.]|jgi:predicted HD superfamily hydrolase involved in NAD metabolism|nr:bis(5'-nucleosyl)-tetraphosphatase (symmetrical) YqeK [Endomicrobium sp.]